MAKWGTTPSDHNVFLCLTCDEALIKEDNTGTRQVVCTECYHVPVLIRRPVVKCSRYRDKTQPSEHSLEKIAWVLQTDKRTGKIGFEPPKKKDPEVIVNDD